MHFLLRGAKVFFSVSCVILLWIISPTLSFGFITYPISLDLTLDSTTTEESTSFRSKLEKTFKAEWDKITGDSGVVSVGSTDIRYLPDIPILSVDIEKSATFNIVFTYITDKEKRIFERDYYFPSERGILNNAESVLVGMLEWLATKRFKRGNFGSSLKLTYSSALDEYPSFSPDGRYLFYITERYRGNRNIEFRDLLTNSATPYLIFQSSEYFPRVSPDSARILFQGTLFGSGWNVLYINGVPTDTPTISSIHIVNENPSIAYTPCWVGTDKIAYARENKEGKDIILYNLENKKRINLTNTPDKRDFSPCFDPHSDSIFFVTDNKGNFDIEKIDLKTGKIVPVLTSLFNEFDPAVSPDGRYLVYSSNVGGKFDIWFYDMRKHISMKLIETKGDSFYPAFSPDGKYVVWAEYGEDEPDIWVTPFNPIVRFKVSKWVKTIFNELFNITRGKIAGDGGGIGHR